jgi:hypothetical protein
MVILAVSALWYFITGNVALAAQSTPNMHSSLWACGAGRGNYFEKSLKPLPYWLPRAPPQAYGT